MNRAGGCSSFILHRSSFGSDVAFPADPRPQSVQPSRRCARSRGRSDGCCESMLSPFAQSAARSRAMPARMSGLEISAPYSRAPPTMMARCGSQRMIRAPMPNQLVGEEEARFEHLLEDHHRPLGLRGDDDHDRQEVGRKQRPRSVVDLRHGGADVVADAQLLIPRNADVFPFDLQLDAELLEHVPHGVHVLGHGIFDHELAARHSGQADVRADLDVIAGDVEVAAVQRFDAA